MLLGKLFHENDLRGNENRGLARLIRRGDFNQRLRVILLAAFEAQAALGHVFAKNDVIASLRVAHARGVADLDAGMLAAFDA